MNNCQAGSDIAPLSQLQSTLTECRQFITSYSKSKATLQLNLTIFCSGWLWVLKLCYFKFLCFSYISFFQFTPPAKLASPWFHPKTKATTTTKFSAISSWIKLLSELHTLLCRTCNLSTCSDYVENLSTAVSECVPYS